MVGHSADQQAIESAKRGGFIMGQHISRQFSVQEARESDLILVMELGHAAKIREAAPELSGKCFLFGHWQDELEIADPYRKSDEFHDAVFARIKTAASTWAGKIGGGTDE
jgi:protein-tyrosine phosphatase